MPEPGVDGGAVTATQLAWYLLAGLACGLLTPLVGLVIAVGRGWRFAAALSILALVFTVYIGAQANILSLATARGLSRDLSPATSPAPPPAHCEEYGGSDNRCAATDFRRRGG